ncbi:MAG TPA: aminotransferase class IV, partial [Bacillota bacterium]|nr:aminotransferase class IV [Bacillota bacterium]
ISCGILNGIVREWILENHQVSEGEYSLEELQQADEVFITNSVMGVMKVNSISGVQTFLGNEVYPTVLEKYTNFLSQF